MPVETKLYRSFIIPTESGEEKREHKLVSPCLSPEGKPGGWDWWTWVTIYKIINLEQQVMIGAATESDQDPYEMLSDADDARPEIIKEEGRYEFRYDWDVLCEHDGYRLIIQNGDIFSEGWAPKLG